MKFWMTVLSLLVAVIPNLVSAEKLDNINKEALAVIIIPLFLIFVMLFMYTMPRDDEEEHDGADDIENAADPIDTRL